MNLNCRASVELPTLDRNILPSASTPDTSSGTEIKDTLE